MSLLPGSLNDTETDEMCRFVAHIDNLSVEIRSPSLDFHVFGRLLTYMWYSSDVPLAEL